MTTFIVTLGLFLDVVYGAAHPAITPAAQLLERQALSIGTIWSPYVVGTDVSYGNFGYNGAQTVIATASYWNWCSVGQACQIGTSCASGTLYYPGSSLVCAATANRCGTEYLFSTTGARSGFTRPACYGLTASTLSNTFFITSPSAGATTTSQPGITTSTPSPNHASSTTSSSTSTSSSPAAYTPDPPPPPPKTPIGAIVGGVVGGLAAIAIAAVAIFFLLRRRKQRAAAAAPPTEVGQHNFPKPQPPPPTTTYDNKHASVVSQYPATPGSPPPMYQNTTGGQGWNGNGNTYALHGGAQQQQQVSEIQGHAVQRDMTASPPVGGMMGTSPQPQQQQYGSPNPATFEMQGSGAHAEPRAGAVEMGGRN